MSPGTGKANLLVRRIISACVIQPAFHNRTRPNRNWQIQNRKSQTRSPRKTTGDSTAQDRICLGLLPFGPDPVRSRPLHRTRPSSAATAKNSMTTGVLRPCWRHWLYPTDRSNATGAGRNWHPPSICGRRAD